ncbi:MAG: dienelactone hydrolase family protein [Candidatus Neomarinimicrobiota bacterium]|nr:dienelactone hydrolase family protein [Candidatus Neomarinimicrobiota bacterium]|tara:strand:- start:5950 stop:6588 length:639 start_codon:yes stop_codon:yes gene_type:complete
MILNYFQESDKIDTAIIGLHGWTGTEYSMVPVAKSMKVPNAKWYIPRAPYNASSGKGYTWFSGSPETGWKSKKTFNLMDKIFNQIINDGFFPNKIILLGFSMGASLAIRYGLTLDVILKGIIPIAGMVRDTEELLDSSSIESKQTPILMIHGKKDSVVDYHNSINLGKILKNNGYTSHVEIVESGHIISIPTSRLVRSFIKTGSIEKINLAL